ncbi:hypothetical protein BaRGS_00026276 [Batillaria attramentaria]|uniref:Uncharacterized protein n=1 Tax=Batillaria attramentaria TaxID=370345 RepID=A0ABD0K5S4_9CAEN
MYRSTAECAAEDETASILIGLRIPRLSGVLHLAPTPLGKARRIFIWEAILPVKETPRTTPSTFLLSLLYTIKMPENYVHIHTQHTEEQERSIRAVNLPSSEPNASFGSPVCDPQTRVEAGSDKNRNTLIPRDGLVQPAFQFHSCRLS